MSRFNENTRLTAQFILGLIAIIAGIVLLFIGIFQPPLGIISESVIIAFGELGTLGGTLIGIDYRYQFKNYETEQRYRHLKHKTDNEKEEDD